MEILDLVLKGKWYDMIASGEKREEYREIKPYWEKRLLDYKGLSDYYRKNFYELRIKKLFFPRRPLIENVCDAFPRGYTHVRFHRGYTNITMLIELKGVSIDTGNPLWGAEPGKEYFVIKLGNRIQ